MVECVGDLNVLLDTVHEIKHCRNSVFCKCQLDSKQIAENSSIVPCNDLENGVIKIQNGMTNDLSDKEKIPASCLRKHSTGKFQQRSSISSGNSMKERIAKRPQLDLPGTNYIAVLFWDQLIRLSVFEVLQCISLQIYEVVFLRKCLRNYFF